MDEKYAFSILYNTLSSVIAFKINSAENFKK